MSCRTVDLGAHQACCSLLQAVFMTARAPIMSIVTVRTIKGVFIATSLLRAPKSPTPDFSSLKNEPAVNRQNKAKRLIAAQISRLRGTSIGNSAQYHYDKKHNSE